MVRIQLETGYLDVKEGTDFPLNLSVGDIRDISKRSGAFSKTITLIGSDNNHNLLNHYYDVNIEAGTFDVNALTQCQVIQNGIPVWEDAYLQLLNVVKSQGTSDHEQRIEYQVLVKDSVADFFKTIGNKVLTDIDLSEYDHTYTSANVNTSFSNDITDGYKYLLPYDIDNLYNLRAFHPAIYAKIYFDKIFEQAGFTYEWGNLDPTSGTTDDGNYFQKLVIPYNGGDPAIDRDSYLVEATKTLTTSQTGLTWTEQVTGFTEVVDDENIFDPTLGDYSVPFWIQNPENISVEVEIDFDIDLLNNESDTIYRNFAQAGLNSMTTSIAVKEQASALYTNGTIDTNALAASYVTGVTNIVTGATSTVNVPITNLSNTDTLELFIRNNYGLSFYTDQTYTALADVDVDVTINSSTWKIIPSANSIGYQSTVNINRFIPKQVKQADFVKGIFNMYNLYVEVDKSQPNKLVLKHRDDFYDDGAQKDWTLKLAKDREQIVQFLPELSAKKTVLTYKQDNDDANTVYLDATSEIYGQLEFTFENEYIRGVEKKELLFSPTPIATTSFNAQVPLISWTPENNIRILIDGGTQTTDSYTIIDHYTNGAQGTTTTTAPVLTHFDDPINPSFDINFGVCDYYFYSELDNKTNNNLYNLYWRRTLGQIDKGKMLTAYFNLDEADIQGLKLSDKIRIDNSWWHINKVIDYNANKRVLTKVELLSIDSEVDLTPYATTPSVPPINPPFPPIRPVKPIKPTKPETVRPVLDIIDANIRAKNLSSPYQSTWLVGTNNIINPNVKGAIVFDDDQVIDESGVYVPILSGDLEVRLPDGTTITDEGLQGSTYNFIDAGTDEVLDALSTSVANEIDAGRDAVLGLGSVVSVNEVDAGYDDVI